MLFTSGAKARIFAGLTAGINACSTLIVGTAWKVFASGSVDRKGAITLKLQGLPRMSVPACVSKARANQIVSIQQSSSLYKSLAG
jgi:hypothetical protein